MNKWHFYDIDDLNIYSLLASMYVEQKGMENKNLSSQHKNI